MDTHVTTSPAMVESPTLRARLPGEPDDILGGASAVPPLHAEPRAIPPAPELAREPARRRRSGLLSGVAIIAVVVVAGGAFLVSPYNTVVPVPPDLKLAAIHAEARVAGLFGHHAAPVALAASAAPIRLSSAATVPVTAADPTLTVLAPSAALAPVHAPAPPKSVVEPPYKPMPQTTEMSELVSLGESANGPDTQKDASVAAAAAPAATKRPAAFPQPSEATTAPAAPPAPPPPNAPSPPPPHQVAIVEPGNPPPGFVAREPGVDASPAPSSAVSHAPNKATSPVLAMPAPTQATVQSAPRHVVPLQVVKVSPGNVLAISPKLQAAPLAPPQQIQVLGVVTQLATLIRDQRTQIANLQADLQAEQKTTSAKLTDYERRLSLVEANSALAAAASTPTTPRPAPAPDATATALTSAKAALASASAPIVSPSVAAVPAPSNTATPEQFRVQAASPGLAMLAEVDHSGGDGAQQEVQVGDSLPGYGRILSVSQQGTSWVVQTEHGKIQ